MKTILEIINEKLKIRLGKYNFEPTTISKKELPSFIQELNYTTNEPKTNKDEYIQIYFCSKNYWEVSDNYYVKIDDLDEYTNEQSMMSIFYNLAKQLSTKYIGTGILYWDNQANCWREFAHAALQKKDKMWHPEWIPFDNHPFK